MLRKTFGPKTEEIIAAWKNCVMTGKELNTRFLWKNLTENELLEDQNVNKIITLKLGWMHPAKNRDSNRFL
jgi:hypothetical protein